MASRNVLIHLHLDLEKYLLELLGEWNAKQDVFEFIGVIPAREFEQPLLTPGEITDDEATRIADQIRKDAKFDSKNGIIIFTEKRLHDETNYQLFVGGNTSEEEPPNISIISLQFLRHTYDEITSPHSKFFSAIVSNIFFSIGFDAGLDDHGDETRGCIMDYCNYMPDIELGLEIGPTFCPECTRTLSSIPNIGEAILDLTYVYKNFRNINKIDRDVTKAIYLRGKRYAADEDGYGYDVALSYSGFDGGYAEQLSECLKTKHIKVFYDKSEQAGLWGVNLQTHLMELYRIRARYCIILVSASYVKSRWTRVEFDAALAREFETDRTYILPIRLDDTRLSGLLSTRAFIDARKTSVEEIAELVRSRLSAEGIGSADAKSS
jgi:predicted Zn-dependent protease